MQIQIPVMGHFEFTANAQNCPELNVIYRTKQKDSRLLSGRDL